MNWIQLEGTLEHHALADISVSLGWWWGLKARWSRAMGQKSPCALFQPNHILQEKWFEKLVLRSSPTSQRKIIYPAKVHFLLCLSPILSSSLPPVVSPSSYPWWSSGHSPPCWRGGEWGGPVWGHAQLQPPLQPPWRGWWAAGHQRGRVKSAWMKGWGWDRWPGCQGQSSILLQA